LRRAGAARRRRLFFFGGLSPCFFARSEEGGPRTDAPLRAAPPAAQVLRSLGLAGKPRTEAHERAAAALAETPLPLKVGHLTVTSLGARARARESHRAAAAAHARHLPSPPPRAPPPRPRAPLAPPPPPAARPRAPIRRPRTLPPKNTPRAFSRPPRAPYQALSRAAHLTHSLSRSLPLAGAIDPRASFHERARIFPVGFRSEWRDPTSGRTFVSEICADEELQRPVFKARALHSERAWRTRVLLLLLLCCVRAWMCVCARKGASSARACAFAMCVGLWADACARVV
jgi:hypothetical protein